ncbi:hypothetical protein DPMN_169949 [Dreissena polymorpha]|uniref:Uncharacterized protein n=1 Tax=Dreissena polymorpha TaxID=45954 RepID=A0A9D4DVB2_DREPO|nr:hypothetical protein DPMN_169949 [Dreissena polymorpha]
MARQMPTRLVMGPCIVEIDRIVIRKVHYQFDVNRCRNEEIIVKGNFGWTWPMWGGGHPRIDCIVIKECRNEEIIVKGNFGWAWPMWAWRPRVGNGAMHMVQYQFEVNRCRNEKIIVEGNFGWAWPMWAWPMWAGRPRIDRIVKREDQYQFEVNRCRNKEIIVKGNFGWAWPMWAGCPRIDRRIVIREVQYQFEVNQCRNEEIIVKGNFGWAGRPRIDCIVIREAQYQFEVNRCRNEEVNFQGSSANSDVRTDRRTSPQYPHLFSEKRGDNKKWIKLDSNFWEKSLLPKLWRSEAVLGRSGTFAITNGPL